jgi:curved DNA-binding protein CbpA
MKTLYDVLGVPPDADAATVRTAFRKAVKAYHPDLRAGDAGAAQRFQQIVAANAILRDGEHRATYDRELQRRSRERRSERTRTIIGCAIAAMVSAGLVGGSALLARVRTAAIVAGKEDRDAACGPAKPAAVRPTACLLPDDAGSHGKRGSTTERDGNSVRTMADVERALGLDRDEASADDHHINAKDAGAGDQDPALAAYDEALRIDPDNPAVLRDRGMLRRRKGALDSALVDLDRAIRSSFTDASAYRDRGMVWYEKGRYDRAIADFDRAIKIDPKFADAYIDRGIALRRKGELDRALADVDHAIRIDPTMLDSIRRAVLTP